MVNIVFYENIWYSLQLLRYTANAAKMTASENYRLKNKASEGLLEALRKLPMITREPAVLPIPRGDREIGAKIEFGAGGREYLLLVETKRFVYPLDARQAFLQLKHRMESTGRPDKGKQIIPLVAAESISPGGKEFLKSKNFGFFDTGGSLFIPARDIYVYIEKPSPKIFQKSVRNLFTGRRSQVLHALLIRHNEWFSVKDLAQFAEVSLATASQTLSALERFEWLDVKGRGPSKERKLANPGALLDEWQRQTPTASRRQTHRRFYVPSSDPGDIARRLNDICEKLGLEYALTEQSAAQIYAPFLTHVSRLTCRLELDIHMNELYAGLGARAVNEGTNLEVIETHLSGEFLFRERVDTVWLASPVQVYLDLLCSDGRSKEMAEHLRHERIGF